MKTHARNSRLITTTLLAVVGSVLVVFPGNTASAVTVDIPDSQLEAAIRDALGKPTGDITDTDLAGLTGLDAQARGIVDLTGLECCVNLEWLWLNVNDISHLGPLSGLTELRNLGLRENGVSDLGPLSGLTKLEMLSLRRNTISDLGPLSGLTSLEFLDLENNNIRNTQILGKFFALFF